MKKIAVMTSGGDAPGMNTAIRAVVRSGFHYGFEVYGINNGFKGLYENDIFKMERKDVSRIINRGGTILGSARFPEFKEKSAQEQGAKNLKGKDISALIVLGGDGSFKGAQSLVPFGLTVVGLPATIDNDIAATDYSIGFFTALDTAVDSIDKLRDTSFSHQRCSVVEVMGRHCGDLALYAGIAVGSEFIITPETGFLKEKTIQSVQESFDRNKRHAIVVVTEKMTDVNALAKEIERKTGHASRATVLGHVQRGGTPAAFDRVLATDMAERSVQLIHQGLTGGHVLGLRGQDIASFRIDDALQMKKTVTNKRYGLVGRLRN
ncbi:MAG: 6-phosphofructokinase [Bacillota bacterium]